MPLKRKRTYSLAEVVAAVSEDNGSDLMANDVSEFSGLSEAVDFVTEDMDADIILLPPSKVDSLSDEEDIDEDILLPAELPYDVPGRVSVYVRNTESNSERETAKTRRPSSSYIQDRACHEVFLDNFFTAYDLLVHLQETNMKASGTARENRLTKCPLMNTSIMKKLERGV